MSTYEDSCEEELAKDVVYVNETAFSLATNEVLGIPELKEIKGSKNEGTAPSKDLGLGENACREWSGAGSIDSVKSITYLARLCKKESQAKTLTKISYLQKHDELEDQQRPIIRQVRELKLRQEDKEQQRIVEGLLALENGSEVSVYSGVALVVNKVQFV